jgi:Leucine-rich repeat (LRR) protein
MGGGFHFVGANGTRRTVTALNDPVGPILATLNKMPCRVSSYWWLSGTKLTAGDCRLMSKLRFCHRFHVHRATLAGSVVHPLANHPTITEVRANLSTVDQDTVATFAGLPKLKTLLLPGRGVTNEGLAELKDHPRIEVLQFSGAQADDAIFNTLETLKRLCVLRMSGTEITGNGLVRLRKCRNLMELDIGSCRQLETEHLWHLTSLPRLQIVFLRDAPIEGAAGVPLASLHHLRELDVSGTDLDDQTFSEFRYLTKLQKLDASGTQIDSAGLRALAACPQLTELHLAHTSRIDDEELGYFKKMPQLQLLTLIGSSVTLDAAKQLQAELPACRIRFFAGRTDTSSTWTIFSFPLDSVTDETLPWALDGEAIDLLRLHGPAISDRSIDALAAHPELRSLWLMGTSHSPIGLSHLSRCVALESLYLSKMPQLDDTLGQHLTDLPNLAMLSIWHCGNYGQGLAVLRKRGLKHLEIRNERLNREVIAEHLVPMGDIPRLTLAEASMNDDDLNVFRQLDVTNELGLFDCEQIHGDGLVHLRDQAELRGLLLDGSAITDQGLQSIAGWKNLERLSLKNTDVTAAALDTLRSLTGLRLLHVTGVSLSEDERRRFREALPSVEIEFGTPVVAE